MIRAHLFKHLDTAEGPMEASFEIDVADTEFLTLFGPSGAGKTTLLRMLAGLEKPDRGVIEVDGETWFDSSRRIDLPPQKRSIGFVFQDYALFPTMSVYDNLAYAAPDKAAKETIAQMLELTELSNLAHRYPATLSGGQKQRVALARALMRHPKILLLDEPLSALDPSMRHKLQDELARIHKQLGLTTLLVSHDRAETVKLSDRIVQIQSGKIVRSCKPLELFSSQTLSGKLHLVGEVLSIEPDSPAYIVTLMVGNSLVRTVASATEVQQLEVGKQAIISSKAFNPILLPFKGEPSA